MSIQDVLDELGASKGAFYHYFDSKEGLLTAVVDRMIDGAMAVVAPMVADPEPVGATRSSSASSRGSPSSRTTRIELLQGVIQAWISDDNAIVREKFRRGGRPAPVAAHGPDRGAGAGRGRLHRRPTRARRPGPPVVDPRRQRGGGRAVRGAAGAGHHVRGRPADAGGLRRRVRPDPRGSAAGRSRSRTKRHCDCGSTDDGNGKERHDCDHSTREADQVLRGPSRDHRRRPDRRAGRGLRVPRAQRGREDDHDPDRARPDPADERPRPRLRHRLERGSGRHPQADRVHPRRVHPVRPPDRRPDARVLRQPARRGRSRPTRRR